MATKNMTHDELLNWLRANYTGPSTDPIDQVDRLGPAFGGSEFDALDDKLLEELGFGRFFIPLMRNRMKQVGPDDFPLEVPDTSSLQRWLSHELGFRDEEIATLIAGFPSVYKSDFIWDTFDPTTISDDILRAQMTKVQEMKKARTVSCTIHVRTYPGKSKTGKDIVPPISSQISEAALVRKIYLIVHNNYTDLTWKRVALRVPAAANQYCTRFHSSLQTEFGKPFFDKGHVEFTLELPNVISPSPSEATYADLEALGFEKPRHASIADVLAAHFDDGADELSVVRLWDEINAFFERDNANDEANAQDDEAKEADKIAGLLFPLEVMESQRTSFRDLMLAAKKDVLGYGRLKDLKAARQVSMDLSSMGLDVLVTCLHLLFTHRVEALTNNLLMEIARFAGVIDMNFSLAMLREKKVKYVMGGVDHSNSAVDWAVMVLDSDDPILLIGENKSMDAKPKDDLKVTAQLVFYQIGLDQEGAFRGRGSKRTLPYRMFTINKKRRNMDLPDLSRVSSNVADLTSGSQAEYEEKEKEEDSDSDADMSDEVLDSGNGDGDMGGKPPAPAKSGVLLKLGAKVMGQTFRLVSTSAKNRKLLADVFACGAPLGPKSHGGVVTESEPLDMFVSKNVGKVVALLALIRWGSLTQRLKQRVDRVWDAPLEKILEAVRFTTKDVSA